jgi:hypothetical protein
MLKQLFSVIAGVSLLVVGAVLSPGALLVALGVGLLYLGGFVIDDEADG